MKWTRKIILSLAVATALSAVAIDEGGIDVRDAQAVVGRPLTPMSYAGVARRTSRRTVRRNMYNGGY